MYLAIPVVLIAFVIGTTVYYRTKAVETVFSNMIRAFQKTWEYDTTEADRDDESFNHRVLNLFKKAYAYEAFEAMENKNKFFLYRIVILFIIAMIPFMMLLLVTKKDVILGNDEWNNIYLYTVILVPLLVSYLLNKFIDVKQYRIMWLQHSKNLSRMELLMGMLIKDFGEKSVGMSKEEAGKLLSSLRSTFIDDMVELWKKSNDEYYEKVMVDESNIFHEIGNLFQEK